MLKRLVIKILEIGIKKAPSIEHKSIKLLNGFMAFNLILKFSFIIWDFYSAEAEQLRVNLMIHACGMSMILSIFYLHNKGFYTSARVLFIIKLIIAITTFSFVEQEKYIELFFAIIPLLSLMFIRINWINFLILFTCFTIHLFIVSSLKQHYDNRLNPILTLTIFAVPFFILYYSQNLNRKQEEILQEERDRALKDKNKIEKQSAELRELNDFKSHFFVNLSHEIRTPITLIKGYINQKDFDTYKDKVQLQVSNLENIVNNIVDLSKIESNELPVEKKEIQLKTFLQKIHGEFEHLFSRKDITFNCELPNIEIGISADKVLLERAIGNLLTNAIKFVAEKGKATIKVNLSDNLIISIIDDGIGISKEDIPKVFDRFYQTDNDISRSQGSGVGLSIVKGIIESHGYQINVTSEEGQGATFDIIIPKGSFYFVNKEAANKVLASSKNTHKKSILLVEDNEDMAEYLQIVLKTHYQVTYAKNGKEGLTVYEKSNFDLILSDFMMPVMNGYEMMTHIRKKNEYLPTIILTARTDEKARLDMLRIGVDAYVNKPFNEEELLLTIKHCLKNDESRTKYLKEDTSLTELDLMEGNAALLSVQEVVYANIQNINLSVDLIAEEMGMNRRTLYRYTKSNTGLTPNEIILECKLIKAKIYFDNNRINSKKDFALKFGFKNTQHFINKFEDRFQIQVK